MDKITTLLLEVGVRPHLSGFGYLHDAIELVLQDKTYLRHITKRLYPDLSAKHGVTQSMVERAIRSAIETMYRTNPYSDRLHDILHLDVQYQSGKLVNSEFIAVCALALGGTP